MQGRLSGWGIHFQTLLEGIVANPEERLDSLPLLTAAERHQLLVEWNDTRADYPTNSCVHELFEAQARQMPTWLPWSVRTAGIPIPS